MMNWKKIPRYNQYGTSKYNYLGCTENLNPKRFLHNPAHFPLNKCVRESPVKGAYVQVSE